MNRGSGTRKDKNRSSNADQDPPADKVAVEEPSCIPQVASRGQEGQKPHSGLSSQRLMQANRVTGGEWQSSVASCGLGATTSKEAK